jgi:general secretion pathway protein I
MAMAWRLRALARRDAWTLRARTAKASRAREDGFTLVEVIVALAVLSVGLGASLGLVSDGLSRTANAARLTEAGALTQTLLARVGVDVPFEERSGEFGDGYRWELKVVPYGDAKEQEAWPVGAYIVTVRVAWAEGTRPRAYELTTLRLGPRASRR